MTYAVILTIPRVAPVRPSAAPAIIKGILNEHFLISRIVDINIDFFTNFKNSVDSQTFNDIDDYFFVKNKELDGSTTKILNQYIDAWIEKIIDIFPEKLFVCIFTWQAQRFAECFLRRFRSRSTIEVIIGGQGLIRQEHGSFTNNPEFAYYMRDQKLIDHWVRGEAETTVPEIVKGNYSAAGIDSDSIADRSNLIDYQLMDFDDFEITKYQSGMDGGVLPMETGRGCLRKCTFCDIPSMQGGFRYKRGKQLANEMITYYKKYNVTNYFFHDALCNGSVRDFREFNEALVAHYTKNNLPERFFKYSSHAIIYSRKFFKPKDFELMSKGGAETMVIGVETGSDRVREHMNKGFTNEDLDYNMQMYSKYKMQVYMLIIIGFPTETDQDFQETLDMLTKYQKYVADGTIIGVNLGTTLTIEEGTEIYNHPEKFKVIGINNYRPQGTEWNSTENPDLTYKKRIMRRIQAQEHAIGLGYTFWKGDDQMKILMDEYKDRLSRLAGVIH